MKPVIFDMEELEKFRQEKKLQPFRVKQIVHEIFQNQNIDFQNMTTLSKDLRQELDENYSVISLECDKILEDQETTKFAFKTWDGHIIETVLMYHRNDKALNRKNGETEQVGNEKKMSGKGLERKLNRITICVSSQVGCPVGCAFCVTGKLGIIRNLTWDEIISQILYANNYIKNKFGKKDDQTWNKIRNVVFMGMGEPLLNYENLLKCFPYLLDQNKLSLSRRHITISTCGIISGIQRLIDDEIPVKLAISLHAPNQELREKLIPVAKTNKLDDLMNMLDKYVKATDNRIFYEYIMIQGVTDTVKLASELAVLLRGQLAHVNLIPYNQNPAIDFEESSMNRIRNFKKILEEGGVTVTIRDSMGREVKSACGQLGYEKLKIQNAKLKRPVDV